MKSFATIVALAAAVSSTFAATVTLSETACISQTQLEQFTIPVGSVAPHELKSVCGLKIVSADGVDPKSLSCQAFKDAEGKEPGSAKFTFDTPASISTNPVQEGSIRCDSASNGTTTTATTLVTASPSGTGSAAPSAASPSGTGSAAPSGNGTAPTVTGTPTPSPAPTGAATQVGLSAGALMAAFAVFLL